MADNFNTQITPNTDFIKTTFQQGETVFNTTYNEAMRVLLELIGNMNNLTVNGVRPKNTGDIVIETSFLGQIVYLPYLEDGFVKLNGATIQRSDYPRLPTYADNKNLWTDDKSREPWKFGRGDGSTTMVLPDLRNVFIEGGDTPAKVDAGLPNIEGETKASFTAAEPYGGTGAIKSVASGSTVGSSGAATRAKITFNAQDSNAIYGKSDTVQPPAIVLIPQMKY